MKYLVAVGACYLDTILTVPHYPSEDEKLRATQLSLRRGGNCPNSLEVLQQLIDHENPECPHLVFFGVLPSKSSLATQQIKDSLGPQVNLSHCIYREECKEAASSYIIKSQATGSRTIVNFNGLPEMTVGEFSHFAEVMGEDAMWYHFEGRIPDVTLECIQYLRAHFPSAKVSVEVEKPLRPGLQELACESDVVFYSRSWAQAHGYHSAESCLRDQAKHCPKASFLCCTWGERGAAVFENSPKASLTLVAPPRTSEVKDSVGAGDTFIGAMLFGLVSRSTEWNMHDKVDFAVRAASTKVTQEGFAGLAERLL